MKKMKNSNHILMTICAILALNVVVAQQNVVFNTNHLASGVIEKGAGSMNSCWLLDSDIYRPRNTSNESRYAEMELGSIRYPYGHLANNYLWDTPPFGGTLEPKVATLDRTPGSWSWATNPDRSMNKIMDFDEFMEICQRQNIKPLVVVNVLSYKYPNAPTYAELKTTAVEWVKYAKAKGYEVAYWQIGNEMDHPHHQNIMTQAEYVAAYLDFAAAMKVEDPTAQIGPGILSKTSYFNSIISQDSSLIDFTSAHQYLFGQSFKDYNGWLNHGGGDLNPVVLSMQNAVNNSSKTNLPILITETNSFGNWDDTWPALYKGLSWFDMLFTQQKHEDVVYSYIWNSHSPWSGETGDGGMANVLFNDADNKLTAMGWPLKILNSTIEERYMIPDSKVNGSTYSYGSYTPSNGKMTVYLLNKSTSTISMTVDINNYAISTSGYQRSVWTGNDQFDAYPTFTQTGTISFTADGFTTSLPPHSLVVIQLDGEELPNNCDSGDGNIFFFNHGGDASALRLASDSGGMDAITTNSDNESENTKWKLVDASDGYVYIQCLANNKKLKCTSDITGTGESITLADETANDDSVKWKISDVGTNSNKFVDNKQFSMARLNRNDDGEPSVGSTGWIGLWVQWTLTCADNTLGLSEAKAAGSELVIFPNPVESDSKFSLSYKKASGFKGDFLQVKVIDIMGSEVFSKEGILDNKFEIETTGLSKGVYFVQIVNQNSLKRVTKKLIVN